MIKLKLILQKFPNHTQNLRLHRVNLQSINSSTHVSLFLMFNLLLLFASLQQINPNLIIHICNLCWNRWLLPHFQLNRGSDVELSLKKNKKHCNPPSTLLDWKSAGKAFAGSALNSCSSQLFHQPTRAWCTSAHCQKSIVIQFHRFQVCVSMKKIKKGQSTTISTTEQVFINIFPLRQL